ncbi:uncharacterized protein C6orf136 homolog [Contarinia nasturtii]|uniref:uncharacterized protein C6orf136 homolog n=1 Tax=Contarinia nasturtii TaxID=265458 RepID=UPI0012D3CA1A|nr:uncharacterized protein C6orf136 homolog [Contarinia nasturtii]
MAICLHKLVTRASAFNPILLQSRLLVTPTFFERDQIESKSIRKTLSVPKPTLLSAEANLLAQNVRGFSNTAANLNDATSNGSSPEGGANEEQLSVVYEMLRNDVPLLFVKPLDYSKTHKDVVFENRIRGKTYYGIMNYVKQMSFLRLWGHFFYAYVKMDVLKITQHTEDSSIKIRWRISGITGYRILFKMLQFRVWDPKKMIEQHQKVWIEGFSTFYVNSDGYIIRHIADKVMPDENKEVNPIQKVVDKLGPMPKLALFVELSTDIAHNVV